MESIVIGMTGDELVESLNNNFSKSVVVVGSIVNAHYSSLNTAVAGIGSIKTFFIQSAITLTADITFPVGCTIIIGTEGSLAGAYTLTGDDTTLISENKTSAINTNITFAGTWICDDTTPELFGAAGDGITDDQTALTKMFVFATLTRTKKVTLGNSKTYYSTGAAFSLSGGITISGNFSTFLKDDGGVFTAAGSISSFVSLSGNAYKGDSWIRCDDSSFVTSLSEGDYVKIRSTEICQPDSGEAVPFGEIHQVKSVDADNDIIYFNDSLFWQYLTANSAEVAKVTMCDVNIENVRVWSISELATANGIMITYGIVRIQNVFVKAFTDGVHLTDCYSPYVRMKSFQQDKDGLGYGVVLSGACMYADISFVNVGCRHCFTTGGGANGGVTWAARVHDSIGILTKALIGGGAFDTHASSGSVYFDNCIAIAGIKSTTYASITDWNAIDTYDVDSMVRSLEGDLFISIKSNSNSDPDDIANIDDWNGKFLSMATGFKAEGLYCYYNNCRAYNCQIGISISGTNAEETIMRNVEFRNCRYGFNSDNETVVKNIVIDGFSILNDLYLGAGYGILMYIDYEKATFNNIHMRNIFAFNILSPARPDTLEINNFTVVNDSPLNAFCITSGFDSLKLSNGYMKNVNYVLYVVNSDTLADSIIINNVSCDIPADDVLDIQKPVTCIILNGLFVKDPSGANYFISMTKDVDNLSIANSVYMGTNATKAIYTDSTKTLDKILHNNNIFPNLTTFKTGTGALAALEVIGGSVGVERHLFGTGDPEGVVTAGKGTLYTRGDGGEDSTLYVKEEGKGNTGWRHILTSSNSG